MKKIFLLSFLFLSYLNFNYAQTATDYIITFIPSGYQVRSLNGYGFENNNLTTISNISNGNPSLITGFENFSLGISKQFNSNIKDAWIADIGYKEAENLLPQSGGIVLPFKSICFGLGVSQIYNAQLDFGKIAVTTIEQPEGTGKFFEPVHKTRIFTSSFLGASRFNNIFSDEDLLSIGVQFNLHFINFKESILNTGLETDFKDMSWGAGFNYKFSKSIPLTQFSVFFEKGFSFKESAAFSHPDLDIDPLIDSNMTRNPSFYTISTSFTLSGYIPDKLSIGLLHQPAENLIVTGNIIGVFWSNYQDNVHNQIELSSNVIYKWDDFITASAGIYLTDKNYFGEVAGYFGIDNSAVFLSLASTISIDIFNIELSLADSHLFSDEWRKQTLFKIGLNIQLL